ncbi:Fc.00g027920.m01.CDS01 [Cosmosporella sp. VM-42]
MPPRLQALPRLGSLNLCLRPAAKPATPNFLPLVQTANLSMREKKRKAKQDPYKWAQAQQRKAANVQRREELKKERDEAFGNPIQGRVTPFVESLDSAGQSAVSQAVADAQLPTSPEIRNHFLTDAELEEAVKHAYTLTKPMVGVVESQMDPGTEEDKMKQHEHRHQKAVEALKRITAMSNSSAKDRFHANVRRIIDEFGRHKTDQVLRPKPLSIHPNTVEMPGRSGPDTGSSEVQIAILTAKIRTVSQALEINRGYKDKHNKRNLRLLLHRRQKLLKYMERKERGSERWTHMIEKLGLTEAAWKGQIEL